MRLAPCNWPKKNVDRAPRTPSYWITLGLARYRAEDFTGAVAAFERASELHSPQHGYAWLFIAMAHWQLGRQEEARKWYEKAVRWIDENPTTDRLLLAFHTEARELIAPGKNRK